MPYLKNYTTVNLRHNELIVNHEMLKVYQRKYKKIS